MAGIRDYVADKPVGTRFIVRAKLDEEQIETLIEDAKGAGVSLLWTRRDNGVYFLIVPFGYTPDYHVEDTSDA